MKLFLTAMFCAVLAMSAGAAQTTPVQADPAGNQPVPTKPETEPAPPASQPASTAAPSQTTTTKKMAPGSVIPVVLTKAIDAKKAKSGDAVLAKVTQDLKTNAAELIIAKDTKIMGHVTECQASSKQQKASQLGIVFDRAMMKDGGEMQVPMAIQAVVGEANGEQDEASENRAEAPRSSASNPSSARGVNGAGAGTGGAGTGGAGTPAGTGTGAGSLGQQSAASGPERRDEDSGAPGKSRPPINAQTQGVIGIPDLKLAPASASGKSSMLTNDKKNVKLESGTMILLRVSE